MTAGMRTTSGAPELAEFVPETDATPVSQLRAAAAIIFGKTNLPAYAADIQTYNEVFDVTNNPWDTKRSVVMTTCLILHTQYNGECFDELRGSSRGRPAVSA